MAKDNRKGGKQKHGKSRERYFARRRAQRGLPERARKQ
jgi:hypothetical protein